MASPNARRRAPPAWVVACGLSLLFLILGLCIRLPAHRLEYAHIANRHGTPLWVVVYLPDPPAYPHAPAAVLCQPFNSPAESARLLALELVQDGFIVLTFDWRGRTRRENRQLLRAGAREILLADAAAAVTYLRRLREVDPQRVMIAGQSVGGTLAIEAATADPTIAAVGSIGMEADVTPERPRNLLWTVGLYDEFRVLNRMRDVFQASAGTEALENTTVREFGRGTARRLGISPTADHFTEMQDREIHRQVLEWFRRAAGLPDAPRPLRMETRALLIMMAWLAALVGALIALGRLAAGRVWPLRIAAALAIFGVILLARLAKHSFLLAADAILWLVVFSLLAGFISTREPGGLRKALRSAGRFALLVWVSLFLTLVVNNLANYVHEPRYVLSVPQFALRHVLDALYSYLMIASRLFLFSVYTPEGIVPRMWVYGVMGIELLSPGRLLGGAVRLARRRSRPSANERPRAPVGRIVLLSALVGALLVIAWLRIQQGFLTIDSALAALRFLLRFAVLPVLIFAFLCRWPKRLPAFRTN